jgi:hypothetical protein
LCERVLKEALFEYALLVENVCPFDANFCAKFQQVPLSASAANMKKGRIFGENMAAFYLL